MTIVLSSHISCNSREALVSGTMGDKFTVGTCISISRNLATRVIDSGVFVERRVQFLIVDVNGSNVGILNIYGPNEIERRAQFWGTLAEI